MTQNGLPLRYLLSHTGHQSLQFTPLNGTRVLFVPFARTSTRQTRACSMVGPSVWNGLPLALRLLPRVHSHRSHSTLAFKLLFLAALESEALLSSNLEEALYQST